MTDLYRLAQISDHIEAHPESFAMDEILSPCGTIGCIAGQTLMLFEPGTGRRADRILIARSLLNLETNEAAELFYAESLRPEDPDDCTYRKEGYDIIQESYLPHVPQALRWMVANKTINWREALQGIGVLT